MEKKKQQNKNTYKKVHAHFDCFFVFDPTFWFFFSNCFLNEFRKWECLKNCSLNDDEVEEVKPALRNDVYNQHYFV